MSEIYDKAREAIDQMQNDIIDLESKTMHLQNDLDERDETVKQLRNEVSYLREQKLKLEEELDEMESR